MPYTFSSNGLASIQFNQNWADCGWKWDLLSKQIPRTSCVLIYVRICAQWSFISQSPHTDTATYCGAMRCWRFKISSHLENEFFTRTVVGRWFQALYDNHWHLTDITTNIEQHKWIKNKQWEAEKKEMANIRAAKSYFCAYLLLCHQLAASHLCV